jgi:hypothetical protein
LLAGTLGGLLLLLLLLLLLGFMLLLLKAVRPEVVIGCGPC